MRACHWASGRTAETLDTVARHNRACTVLLFCQYRPALPCPTPPTHYPATGRAHWYLPRCCREIALDGLRAGVATGHSVLLCFFFGPTGLLSHAITRLVMGRGRA